MNIKEILHTKKWLVIGIAAACALLILAACLFLLPGGKTPTGGNVTPGSTVTVTVKNRADAAIKDVQVYIYADAALTDLVSFAKTDAEGKMSFTSEADSHYAVLKGLHPGYRTEAFYPITGTDTAIVLDALASTDDGNLPTDVKFAVGDPMMDFTVTDIDGNTYTASAVLQEKKALVLNFWYTACQPCQMEFPYLQAAYELYKADVQVLAMDPYGTDTADSIKAFRDQNGLTMPVVAADASWVSAMNIQAYPTTVVIDRYGMIAYSHVGAITEEGVFEDMFALYGGTEYDPTPDDEGDGSTDGGSNSTTDGVGSGTTASTNESQRTEFKGVLGTAKEPLEIGGTLTFSAEIPAGKESHIHVYRVGGTILTVKSNTIAVEYDGKTYTPKNGVVEIPVTTDDVTIPVKLVLHNTGSATETYTVNFVYPAGSLANPLPLKMGELTTDIKAGNDQGVVYTYIAPDNGIVEMTAVSATNGAEYDFVLYNLNTYANRTLGADGSSKKVSIAVNKGDTLQVTVGVLPNKDNEYPASVIKSNLTFTPSATAATKPTLPSTAAFSVTVKDDAGAAMAGVTLKFEVGDQVKTVVTDQNGVAAVEMNYGDCKATITVPDGYVAAKLVYNLTPAAPTASVVLELDDWFDDPVDTTAPTTNSTTQSTTESTTASTTQSTTGSTEPGGSTTESTTSSTQSTTESTTSSTTQSTTSSTQPTTPPTNPNADYTVKVVDGNGAAQSGITVEFYSGSTLAEQQVTDAEGTVTVNLLKGNYRVKLSGTDLKFDERAATLTASKTALELLVAPLYDNTVLSTVNCPLTETDKDAYYLNEGATYVELVPGERNYFLYEPARTGTFRFTTTYSKAAIGYYGSPFFVQPNNVAADLENNAFTMSVSGVGPTYVIAVDAPTNISGTIISITRIGEPGWSIADEPWVIYEGTHTPTKFTLPADTTLVNVDITAASQEVVYNEQDGYYHLNSAAGPVLYLRFSGSPYINLSDIVANQRVGAYLYDASGEFLRKEEYNGYLQKYYYVPNAMYDPTGTVVNMLDKNMVYPLNADLLYILQTYYAHQQWGNPDSPNYLFKDTDGEPVPGINTDIAWMFPLCYAE